MTFRVGILAVAWIVMAYATPVYAYVDPGSGGMIAQLLLGGAAGVAVLVKLFWHRLTKAIGWRQGEGDEAR